MGLPGAGWDYRAQDGNKKLSGVWAAAEKKERKVRRVLGMYGISKMQIHRKYMIYDGKTVRRSV